MRHLAVALRDRRDPAEARLGALGWYDEGAAVLRFWTGANHDTEVPIEPGVLIWERLPLSDGTLARLVISATSPVAASAA